MEKPICYLFRGALTIYTFPRKKYLSVFFIKKYNSEILHLNFLQYV